MIDPVLRDRDELLSASLTVASAEEIELLFLEFQAAGATFFQTLKREPWDASDFIVRDPDGNLLLVCRSGRVTARCRPAPSHVD